MPDEHFGKVRIQTLEPLRVAAYAAMSETPEEDALGYMARWVDDLNLPVEDCASIRTFGFDIAVSEEQSRAGYRGYEVWKTVPGRIQPVPPVRIVDFPGGLYAIMRISDPFTDAFHTIPGGWARLLEWGKKHVAFQLASGQGLEEGGTDERGTYLDLYLSIEPVREVKIVRRDALKLAGLRYEGKGEHGEIPAMWEVFLPRAQELVGERPEGVVFYGVARAIPGVPEEQGFEYLAATEVPSFENLPDGMVGWKIPALTYAVLPAYDVPGIDPVSNYFYRKWLPQSGYEGDAPLMIELYPEAFGQDLVMYLHFPVRPKAT